MKKRYGRRGRGKKRFKRKGYGKRKAPSVRRVAKKVRKIEKSIAAEYKVLDDITADGAYSASASGAALVLTSTGGAKVFGIKSSAITISATPNIMAASDKWGGLSKPVFTMVSMNVRGSISLPDGGTFDSSRVRIIFYWDTEAAVINSGAAFLNNYPVVPSQQPIANLTQNATVQPVDLTNGGTINTMYNPCSVGRGKRFQILMDRVYTLKVGSTTSIPLRFRFPLRKRVTCYYDNGSTGYVSLLQNFGCFMWSDKVLTAGPVADTYENPVANMTWRLCYSD